MCSGRPARGIHLSLVLIGQFLLAVMAGQAMSPSNLFGAEEEQPAQKTEAEQPPKKAEAEQPAQKAKEERPPQKAKKKRPPQKAKEEQPAQKAEEEGPAPKAAEEQPAQKAEEEQPTQRTGAEQPTQKAEEGAPPRKAKEEQPARKWALLVGIDTYTKLPALKFAGPTNATLAAQLVKTACRQSGLVMHEEATKKPWPSQGEHRTAIGIAARSHQGLVEKGDLVIVSFSGHGTSLLGKSYLCPSEADEDDPAGTMISLESVYRQLDRSRATQKLLVVDACHSDPTRGDAGITMSAGLPFAFANRPGASFAVQLRRRAKSLRRPGAGPRRVHAVCDRGLAGKAARDDGDVTLMGLYAFTSSLTRRYAGKSSKRSSCPFSKEEPTAISSSARSSASRRRKIRPRRPRREAGPGRAKLISNSVGMKLALIPAGEFLMGSPDTESSYGEARGNRAAAPGADHSAVLFGCLRSDAGAIPGIMGKNPSGSRPSDP